MRQIRVGAFETNSSSTHSLIICTEQELNDWVSDKLLYDEYDYKFVDKESLNPDVPIESVKEDYEKTGNRFYKSWDELSDEDRAYLIDLYKKNKYDSPENWRYSSYKEWYAYSDLETFTEHFTTPSGDKMVAIGKYGYDG